MKLIHPLAVVLCAAVVSAQTGSNCVFNSTLCTCLFGNAEGDCWDPVTGRRGFCAKRVCDAGWTCDCDGDYYCHRGPTTVSLVDPANVDSNPAACRTVNNEIRINVAGCKLGNFRPLISAKGFNAGQCQNWQWFFNGASQNSFSYDSGRQPADRNAMARWEDLPLKPGDVIAHRFKNEWEECYEGAFLSVNGTSSGTATDTRNALRLRAVYTKTYFNGWFNPGFDDSRWLRQTLPFNSDVFTGTPSPGRTKTNTYWRITIL